MIWFFTFTAMGMGLTLTLLVLKWAFRPGWRSWISGFALLSLMGFLSRLSTGPRHAAV